MGFIVGLIVLLSVLALVISLLEKIWPLLILGAVGYLFYLFPFYAGVAVGVLIFLIVLVALIEKTGRSELEKDIECILLLFGENNIIDADQINASVGSFIGVVRQNVVLNVLIRRKSIELVDLGSKRLYKYCGMKVSR